MHDASPTPSTLWKIQLSPPSKILFSMKLSIFFPMPFNTLKNASGAAWKATKSKTIEENKLQNSRGGGDDAERFSCAFVHYPI